ncbi:MAG: GntR family transcriptional regulator [bacterium]|nr:GntR family transcriptional regulator [bacterium]
MRLRLDPHSGEPIYRQIVEQVKYLVACGSLAGDEQLPSIRALAGDLKINPRTVVKAYEELQKAGLVVMKHGQGVFVASRRESTPAGVRADAIAGLARRLLAEAARMGADETETVDIVRRVAVEMGGEMEKMAADTETEGTQHGPKPSTEGPGTTMRPGGHV